MELPTSYRGTAIFCLVVPNFFARRVALTLFCLSVKFPPGVVQMTSLLEFLLRNVAHE